MMMSFREVIVSLWRIAAICASTVLAELPLRAAIAVFVHPAAASVATCRSAFDSSSQREWRFALAGWSSGILSMDKVPSASRCTSQDSGRSREPCR